MNKEASAKKDVGCEEKFKMAATVGLIKNITEALLGIGEVSIDNFTFKLFYKW